MRCFYAFFFFNDTATTEIYTLSLHDALPISCSSAVRRSIPRAGPSLCKPARPRYYPPARMYGFLVSVLILDSLVLTTAILLQAGQGGGLASLRGGAGTAQFIGGGQATTPLPKLPWWFAGGVLFLSLVL